MRCGMGDVQGGGHFAENGIYNWVVRSERVQYGR